MKGKALSSGERKIIFNVFNYFKTENPSLKRNALVEMTVNPITYGILPFRQLRGGGGFLARIQKTRLQLTD